MKVSIILPVYNKIRYIRSILNDIEAQSFTTFECIVVDDGSTDLSGKICDDFAEKDKRFSSYRPMVYALVAVCVLLVCVLVAYMIFDASIKDAGLFQSTGTSIFVVALALLILATIGVVGIAVRSDVVMWQKKK